MGSVTNVYQKQLAERSLVESPTTDGEEWDFRWYVDPISNGLSKWYQFRAHVFSNGDVHMYNTVFPQSEEALLAQDQAVQFVTERYEEYGVI